MLLVERERPSVPRQWALPGGFVEPDEELDDAARRELQEETGVLVASGDDAVALGHLEQLRTYGTPDRDPAHARRLGRVRRVHCARRARRRIRRGRRAVLGASTTSPIDGIGSADGAPLAFDHARVIADGVERARAKLEYTTLATAFLDEPFTLGELRRVYEAVWGESLHEGNFRRKVLVDARLRRADRRRPRAPTAARPRCTGAAARCACTRRSCAAEPEQCE